jgi:ribosomal protein S20
MVEEFGKKGLNVLALTNESRETVLKFMTQLTPAPVPYTIGLGGGSGNYPASGIPKAFLISAEGKVVWEGSPGAFPGKLLEAELKKVKVTDEMKAARAQKALDYAETLIAAKQYLRAANLLDRTVKDFGATEPGKKAQERRASLDRDEAMKKELAAQKAIDKAVSGGDKAAPAALFKIAQPVIDSVADKGIFHKNKAARHKSRLAAKVKALAVAA